MAEYIKRKDLLEIIDDIAKDETCPTNIAEDIYYAVDSTPAADVEPVIHGHWEADVCDRMSMAGKFENLVCYKCSACEMFSCQETKYCYNCGAKMDKENNE